MSDLVPQSVRDLLAFYTENYPEVRFGDLDIRVLTRAVESIDEAAAAVIAAEALVSEARAKFRGVEAEILVKASRTLSFLKIYVDDDTEQLAKLEAIAQGLPAGRRKAKASADASSEPRQRRPRKSKNVEEATTEVEPAAEEEAAEVEAEPLAPAPVAAVEPVGKTGSKGTGR